MNASTEQQVVEQNQAAEESDMSSEVVVENPTVASAESTSASPQEESITASPSPILEATAVPSETSASASSEANQAPTEAAVAAETAPQAAPAPETTIEHCLKHTWDEFFKIYSRVGYFTEEHARQLLHYVAQEVEKLATKI